MKKSLKKKLSLTKTTISDLDRVKGGKPPCACDIIINNAACNYDRVQSVNRSACLSCYEDVFTSCG
jgi:hypothetical protein